MIKKISIAVSVLLLAGKANADTLLSVLNDIQNNMIVVEKSGSCDRNPNLMTTVDSKTRSLKPCNPVVAQCPAGTTIIPGLSKCKRDSANTDTELLGILKKIKGDSVSDLSKPDGYSTVITSKTSMKTNQQLCGTDADGWEWTNDDSNYSPFCFFDLSKVEYVSDNNFKFAVQASTTGSLVEMRNKPASYNYTYPQTFDSVNNYSKITTTELNNSSNYKCFAINIKATARCIAVPVGFVKKLGVDANIYK
ncbi:MAG: hypothetical protein WCJ11_12190 [Methylococcaceae bacterium]